jgi:hypothetical protein
MKLDFSQAGSGTLTRTGQGTETIIGGDTSTESTFFSGPTIRCLAPIVGAGLPGVILAGLVLLSGDPVGEIEQQLSTPNCGTLLPQLAPIAIALYFFMC